MPMKMVICCRSLPNHWKTVRPYSLRSSSVWERKDSERGTLKPCLNPLSANRKRGEHFKTFKIVTLSEREGSDPFCRKAEGIFFISLLGSKKTDRMKKIALMTLP